MNFVISDLHGYSHDRFLELLEKAKFSDDDVLYILGDVIDRNGDGGVETLQWLLYQPNAQLILGNHEAMLLGCSFVFDEISEDIEEVLTLEKLDMVQRYMADGGDATLKAMHKISREEQLDILEYLRECPLYETLSVGEQDFLLVHAGLGSFVQTKRFDDYSMEDLLWTWPQITDEYYEDIMTVFGHTPTLAFGEEYQNKVIHTKTWTAIDMGAGFGHEPVLVRLDDMTEFRLGE